MCIVFLKYRMDKNYPIMLAANREESLLRPTHPACCPQNIFYAGLDHGPDGSSTEQGTWLGVNLEHGLLVAVTNRDDGPTKAEESRGVLCNEILKSAEDADMAVEYLQERLAAGLYASANYIVLTPKKGFVVSNIGRLTKVSRIRKGIHAITNLNLNDPEDKRISFVKDNLTDGGTSKHFVDAAQFLCCHKNVVINDPEWGTVSSCILLFNEAGTVAFVSSGVPVDSDSFLRDERYHVKTYGKPRL